MSKPDLWMPIYIGDYLRDTQHLSTALHGAYFLLLMASWMRGGTLPDNDEMLAAICKLDARAWAKAKPVLREFFDIADGVWKQKRLVQEYQQAKHISETNRENGKKGGRPPKAKRNGTESVTESGTETKTDSKPNGIAKPNPEAKRNETPAPPPSPSQESITSSGSAHAIGVAPTDAALLSKTMREYSIDSNPGDPRILALAAQGVTTETVAAACEEARRQKPGERIPPGFIVAIVERWSTHASKLNVTGSAPPLSKTAQAMLALQEFANESEIRNGDNAGTSTTSRALAAGDAPG